jgi:hypothetical protein
MIQLENTVLLWCTTGSFKIDVVNFFLILDEIKLFMTFTRYRSKSDDYIVIILRSIPLAECGSDMKLCKY